MNGYVKLETPEGEPIIINADRVNVVRRFRGGNDACAINFEKGNFVVVRGGLDAVMKALAQG